MAGFFRGLDEDVMAAQQRQLAKLNANKFSPDRKFHQDGRLCRTELMPPLCYLSRKF